MKSMRVLTRFARYLVPGIQGACVVSHSVPKRKALKMRRQRVVRILSVGFAFVCVAKAGWAQTLSPTATQPAADQSSSAAAQAQEATNPFATSWLMQVQQNNNWVDMPLGHGSRVQSNLLFQPLMSLRLTENQALIIRPVVTVFNSVPHLDQNGQGERTTAFGDTVLAFAVPRPLLGGRLMLGAGPTFVFPTASKRELGQDTWQFGPDVGAVLQLRRTIAYAFVQQWFKVAGDGPKTNQMSGVFNYTYVFERGWTLGTQSNLSVDWEARAGERVSFPIGPQVGKMVNWGGTPTLVQLQFQYYPVRPNAGGPQWNVQLQVTPTLKALIRKPLF
jgi:hypothetical protein